MIQSPSGHLPFIISSQKTPFKLAFNGSISLRKKVALADGTSVSPATSESGVNPSK